MRLVMWCMLLLSIITNAEVLARDITVLGEDIGGNYFSISKCKLGIPFAIRRISVSYPDDFGITTLNEVVRGIRHYNDVKDSFCRPQLEITEGGFNQTFATLSITSKSGCPMNSTVGFITSEMV